MAAALLRDNLTCFQCMSIYTDPVSLLCGHNFCQGCIEELLDTQEGSGGYSCPKCRDEFQDLLLPRNMILFIRVEKYHSDQAEQDGADIFCTYCVHSLVPAAKSCLQGETSMCDAHVTANQQNTKCFELNELLKYYCNEDGACICESCCLAREHRDHKVELLNEASEKKKEKLRNLLEKLRPEAEETERRTQKLQDPDKKWKKKQTEIKKEDQSMMINHIDKLCKHGSGSGCDLGDITHRLIWDCGWDKGFVGKEASGMILDINTAGNNVIISGDGKTASYSKTKQGHPQDPGRFQSYPQALSNRSFSSGQHCWDVKGSEAGFWWVGVSCSSMDRSGIESGIWCNKKSWTLCGNDDNSFAVIHDSLGTSLPQVPACRKIRILLDHEGGCLSFYELREPLRHLHTFTASFSEPLHAAFRLLCPDSWVRILS
ncbi:hypothetical protein XELAEV_18043598mg [Xenopus laevis]|uniref:Uncharacterized protein n=1 Tax=Xenopus laevis TaxID=8355 RepID=A0A974BX26_XENLA|nr:hypothetical protein XELAEV_18043598mg [Xenopus laevis]